jgi:hypothetical protein
MAHSIDYAGMFPPCSLPLHPAIKNQAGYVRSADAWMLGAFVLSTEQFNATRELLSEFDAQHPLRIAALGRRTATADAFLEAVNAEDAAIRAFAQHNVDLISISHLEMLLPNDVDIAVLNEARSILGDLPVFWEAPPERAEQTIALLAQFNSDAGSATFGYKLRTGGVTVDAFPTSMQIARALVTPATHQLPLKFTAGLHHPIRQFRSEVKTKMHGFLNVLGAAVLSAEHQWDTDQTAIMLEDENAKSFLFTDDGFSWREWRIDTERLEYRRRFIISFGSCSFDEPGDDLRALNLL